MIQKPFDSIAKTDIDSLISNGVHEGRTIEYKRDLPGSADDDKREFLADVSSFANAGGGDLIYGIAAKDGVPQTVDGLGFTPDAEKLRLESILRDSIEPRIMGIRISHIEGFPKGSVLLIRIPKSWNAPHIVTFKNWSRFFTRNSAGKYQMDVTEIRSAFLLSESLPDKIKRFRDERLAKIIANETPVPLDGDMRVILHILPAIAFSNELKIDITTLEQYITKLNPFCASGWNHRYNLDGFVTLSGPGDGGIFLTYCQVFRSSQIEVVSSIMLFAENEKPVIPSNAYERDVIKTTFQYLEFLKLLEIQCPIVILLSFTGVKGAYLATAHHSFRSKPLSIDRDCLTFPDVLVEDYASVSSGKDVAKILHPIFDAVWNACGFARSLNYDEQGNWNPRR